MLRWRILSALLGIPVLLAVAYLGGLYLATVVGVLIIIGTGEFIRLARAIRLQPHRLMTSLGGLSFLVGAYLSSRGLIRADWLAPVLLAVVGVNLGLLVITYPRYTLSDSAVGVFGSVYVGWLLSHLFLLRDLAPQGFDYLLLTLILTWSTDTGAYFTGRAIGRRKLAPQVSPNKTLEGALGGVAGSLLAAMLLYYYYKPVFPLELCLGLGILVSILGQFGDLVESALKRLSGIKDSGHLIPGHGGVLDRFDSLLLTGPAVYYYLKWFVIG